MKTIGSIQVLIVIFCAQLIFGQNEESSPMTNDDWELIRNLPADIASIQIKPNVLSQSFSTCRLVYECRKCSQKPHKVTQNIYEESCDDKSHVKNCRRQNRVVVFEKGVKICHNVMEKVCETPCFSCPEFCQPDKQFWCEDDFSISTDVVQQDGVYQKVEKIVPKRTCFEKLLQPLCATLNCKFQVTTRECMDAIKPINVTLSDQVCDICHPIAKVEQTEMMSVCHSTEIRKCPPDSDGKWVKKCRPNSREPRNEEDSLNEVIPLQELFDMTSKPVRDLLLAKSKNQANSNNEIISRNLSESPAEKTRTPIDMKELMILNVRGISKTDPENDDARRDHLLATETGQTTKQGKESEAEGRKTVIPITTNYIDEPTTISEYFNPINNVIATAREEIKIEEIVTSSTSISTTASTTTTSTTTTSTTTATTTTTTSTTTTTPIIVTIEDVSTTTISTTSEAIVELTTQSTLTAAPIEVIDEKAPEVITSNNLIQNEVADVPLPATTTSDPQFLPIEIETTIPAATSTEPPTTTQGFIQLSAKEQARLCLFHGICDVNQVQKYLKTTTTVSANSHSTTTSTTTKAVKTTTQKPVSQASNSGSGSNFAILAQIQRCIQTPEFCNTNMIQSGKTGNELGSTTSTTTTTTTTAPTTLSALEIARSCVINGNCDGASPRSSRLLAANTESRHLTSPGEEPRTSGGSNQSSLAAKVRLCLFSHICN